MLLEPGHNDGEHVVHLTHTTIVEAICGVEICHYGEPELAVICATCDEAARAAGYEHAAWITDAPAGPALPLAEPALSRAA